MVGTTLGHYKILEEIGRGGMGVVYKASDTRLGRTVALKVLPPALVADAERRARFLEEARAAAEFSHPHVATLFEIGEDGDRLFLVFEYVPGETLRAMAAGRPLNPRRAAEIAIQIADALAEAHAHAIVHRDLKPENIIISPRGQAKILDVGLATWTEGGARRDAAPTEIGIKAGTVLRTVAYMSPEQALGEPADERTDIFSLGVILYEMLTGRAPFPGPGASATLVQILQITPPSVRSVNSAIPASLEETVKKAMSKDLTGRHQSAAQFAADLRRSLDELDRVADFTLAPLPRARPRRVWGRYAVVLLILLALMIVGVVVRSCR